MRLEIRKALALSGPICLLAVLFSCAPKPIGYGVVFWAEKDSPFQTGELVRIIKESQIQEVYLVNTRRKKELKEIELWRVRMYATLEEAVKSAAEYSENVYLYGYTERDGLPLREKPHQEARRVYKLREGQLVKIIAREKEKVKIASYEDYWYRVLTEDGSEGYSFGYYLNIFSTRGDPQAEAEKLRSKDPVLDEILATVWRPEYFKEMTEEGRVDLFRFRKEIGFFPRREDKRLILVTSKYSQVFDYDEAENVGPNRYLFTGTDLRAHITEDRRLILSYSRGGQIISSVYVLFEKDLDEVISAEHLRREKLFREFLSRGETLRSTAYGNIRLQTGRRFLWKDFERLAASASGSSRIFLKPVEGSGRVDFPYFLSEELSRRYDGIITFRFAEYFEQEGTSFLYEFDDSGVRCVFIPPENIDNLEAVETGIQPLVVYFTFGKS